MAGPGRAVLACVLGILAAGCSGTSYPGVLEEPAPLPDLAADSVDAVLFLVGDAGDAPVGRGPVMEAVGSEVEAWGRLLPSEAPVDVLYLGDNVYPVGIRTKSDRSDFVQDSLRLRNQVDVVAGPEARVRGSRAWFLAGNHDWGNLPGEEGLDRLRNQAELLEALRRDTGAEVALVPDPGRPGPVVRDVGRHLRLALLDTHWWLQAHGEDEKAAVLGSVEEAIRGAGERAVILAAHHPFESGGPHVAPLPVWEGLGFLYLLRQTGSLVQDVNAAPYTEMAAGLREAYRRAGRPLAFAAGHDHSLQVLELDGPERPRWSLVSGSGSKLTGIREVPGLFVGVARPGYMRVTALRDGSVLLHVRATRRPGVCPEEDREACMAAARDAFETVYTARLRGPVGGAPTPDIPRGGSTPPPPGTP